MVCVGGVCWWCGVCMYSESSFVLITDGVGGVC